MPPGSDPARISHPGALPPVRALLVVDPGCSAAATAALDDALDLASACVSVVGLPERGSPVEVFATLAGAPSTPDPGREREDQAAAAARSVACHLQAARVDHRVVASWQALNELIASGRYHVVVLGPRPRGRRLRRLAEAASATATALVVAPAEAGR